MRENKMLKRITLLFLLVLVLCVGCQRKQKLTGRITFPDGKPLTTGTVFFVTDSYMGRGRINSDGTYHVGSEAERDGLPKGNYTVYIVGAITEDGGGPIIQKRTLTEAEKKLDVAPVTVKEATMRPLIDPKYMSLDDSPLKFTIPGEREFNFTVEAP